jgi:hypothetical protein
VLERSLNYLAALLTALRLVIVPVVIVERETANIALTLAGSLGLPGHLVRLRAGQKRC